MAPVALLSGIALSPEVLVGTVGFTKNRDLASVGRSRTSRGSLSLPFSFITVSSARTLLPSLSSWQAPPHPRLASVPF